MVNQDKVRMRKSFLRCKTYVKAKSSRSENRDVQRLRDGEFTKYKYDMTRWRHEELGTVLLGRLARWRDGEKTRWRDGDMTR